MTLAVGVVIADIHVPRKRIDTISAVYFGLLIGVLLTYILWIAVEDISPFLGCYGYDNPTPNLDRLAGDGMRFTNAFMPAPVCSPCRSAMITGAMATTHGTHNHPNAP